MDKTPALYPMVTQGTGANPRFGSLVSLRKNLYLTFSSPPSCKVGTCEGSDGYVNDSLIAPVWLLGCMLPRELKLQRERERERERECECERE